MQSLNINPKPVIHTDEHGKKKIKEWKLILNKKDLPFKIDCESNTRRDLVNHESLFGLAKELGITIPDEYYFYQVENQDESILLTSKTLEVLKLAIGKVLENYHDKKLTIKRQWKINFREKKEEEADIVIPSIFEEDNDY
tara:strand:+ start:130 stop:549 length:420 start_codon:yes stop_codon:yes gene_type:complete